MKKEPIILFPGSEEILKPKRIENPLYAGIGLRDVLKIGQPSNRYYQFIYPTLDFKNHQLDDLSNLIKIKNTVVTVTSILTMKGGRLVAVLRRYDGKYFYDRLERVFADIDESIKAKELVALNLEERNILKNNSNK